MGKDVADMDPEDLPEVRAFQDDYTRDFMASTEPVEEGYYEFESKTDGYTMKYPENATMDKLFYERNKNTFEHLQFGEDSDTSSIPYYVETTYDHFYEGKKSKRLLNLLSKSINYEGDYEEFEHGDNTIYFATLDYTTEDNQTTWYRFFGLIKSNSSNQSLRYIFNVQCKNQSQNYSYDLKAIEQKVKSLMKSVEFNDVELEGGEG